MTAAISSLQNYMYLNTELKTAHQQNANHTLSLASKSVEELQIIDSPSTLTRKVGIQICCKKIRQTFSTLMLVHK